MKNNHSMIVAILWGFAISVLFSILGAAIGACVLDIGSVNEKGILWISGLTWSISVFCGIMLSLRLYKNKIVIVTGVVSGIYILVLTVVNILFLNQKFSGLGVAVISVLAGAFAAAMLNSKEPNGKRKKIRYRTK